MSRKILRTGLIGFGFIGKVHAFAHRTIPFYYDQADFSSEITMLCTSNPKTAEQGAVRLGGNVIPVTDYHEITENPDIDVVDICTPNHLHCGPLLSAMAHGKHIYCDKPLCAAPEETLQIADSLKSYRGISQMTLQNRFYPSTMRAKQIIEDGLLGDILQFRGEFLHSGSVDPNTPLRWKLSGAAGGGVIADLGVHILDLMEYLLGGFSSVSAVTRTAYPTRPSSLDPNVRVPVDAEDAMFATLMLANGAIGTVTASKIATGTEDGIGFEIHGTKGALKMIPMDLHHLYFYDQTASALPLGGNRGWTAIDCGQRYDSPAGFPTPKAVTGWLRGHVHCMYHFLKAVSDGVQPDPGLIRGVELQNMLETIRISAKEKAWKDFQ